MVKRLIVMLAAASVVLVLAAPAQAKGPGEGHVTISGVVKVEGPGLPVPIVLGSSGGQCGIVETCWEFAEIERQGDFLTFATDAGVTGYVPAYASSYYVRPGLSRLGPAYRVRWTFIADDGVTSRIDQTLYPYAPGRPWVRTAPGQAVFEARSLNIEWMATPPSLFGLLRAYGLPARSPAAAGGRPSSAGGATAAGMTAAGAAGALLLLLVAAAVAGRRRAGKGAA